MWYHFLWHLLGSYWSHVAPAAMLLLSQKYRTVQIYRFILAHQESYSSFYYNPLKLEVWLLNWIEIKPRLLVLSLVLTLGLRILENNYKIRVLSFKTLHWRDTTHDLHSTGLYVLTGKSRLCLANEKFTCYTLITSIITISLFLWFYFLSVHHILTFVSS